MGVSEDGRDKMKKRKIVRVNSVRYRKSESELCERHRE